jgi:hypothetical protein
MRNRGNTPVFAAVIRTMTVGPMWSGRTMCWLLIGAGAATFWASIVHAEQVPLPSAGTKLLEACESQDVAQHAYCRGYIEGIADVVLTMGRRSPITACIPPSTTKSKIIDITVEYLRDHPRISRSYIPAVSVLEAIRKEFRCR